MNVESYLTFSHLGSLQSFLSRELFSFGPTAYPEGRESDDAQLQKCYDVKSQF